MENVRHLLLHAAPSAPGAVDLVARFAGARILLAGPGLAWAGDERLAACDDVAVCSQDARASGWTLEAAPEGVRWSSVATWLAEVKPEDGLWTVLP